MTYYTIMCNLLHMYIHVYTCVFQAFQIYRDCYLETQGRKVVSHCGRKYHMYAHATAQIATP